jgi:hypothetical protein
MDLVRRKTEHAPSIYIIILWETHTNAGYKVPLKRTDLTVRQ